MADGDSDHAEEQAPQRPLDPEDGDNHDNRDASTTTRDEQERVIDDQKHPGEPVDDSSKPKEASTDEDSSSMPSPHVAVASASSLVLPLTDPILALDPDVSSVDELVAMLRGQITDLVGQVTSLNSKLVKSYTQRGEIEDDLHDTQEQEALLKMKVAELERERERWTKEIEAGGWVEKNHVQGEMQRLMATVMEETKSRETAVQAHTALETEIENLTSNLFTEANKMVAFERLARARAEEKTRTVEEAGVSMQALLEEVQVGLKDTVLKLEARDAQVADLKRRLAAHGEHVEEDENVTGDSAGENDLGGIVFSDGERLTPLNTRNLSVGGAGAGGGSGSVSPSPMSAPRLLTSVLPYQEFLAFINYLRQTRITALSKPPEHSSYPALTGRSFASDPIPAAQLTPDQLLAPHLLLSTHLSQAFLKRCVEEDSDPALRLDLAPGLGFLSRRSVATAIVDGSLVIEPLHSSSGGGDLPSDKCSLCGCSLERWLPNSGIVRGTKPTTTAAQSAAASVNSTMRKISSSFFSRSASSSHLSATSPASTSAPPLPPRGTRNHSRTPSASEEPLSFLPASTAASHHPHDAFLLTHTFRTSDKSQSQRYTVCPSYCLPRLRAVCEFWTYVRVLLRGLLLEESFRFGQAGDNNNGSIARGGHGSTTPTPTTPARTGSVADGLGITELAPEETAAAPTTASADEGIEAKDFEAEDTHGQEQPEKEEDEEEEKEAEGEGRDATEDKADEAEGSGENVEQPGSGSSEQGDTGTEEEKKKKEDEEEGENDTAPGTPTLATDSASVSRSGSVKPPRPARSSARNSPRPPSNPSPPGSPIVATDKKRPVLPPRRHTGEGVSSSALPPPPPRHPSHAVTAAESQAAGGGTGSGSGSGWEDRCWGEVVRLKEAVFWSRVAAVAADGEAVSSRGAKVWS